VYAFARPEVKETVADYGAALQTKNQGKEKSGLMVRDTSQQRNADNLMQDHISSEKAYVLELYCNQRNQFLFGPEKPISKKKFVDYEAMTDEARKQLKDSFVKLYSEQKEEMFPIVVRIVADRNAKMGAITAAKQKLVEAYDEVRRELSKTYPQKLVNECLISRFYYASPKAYADVPAGVADKSVPLPGYEVRFLRISFRKLPSDLIIRFYQFLLGGSNSSHLRITVCNNTDNNRKHFLFLFRIQFDERVFQLLPGLVRHGFIINKLLL
jgi:hypothetical protein